MIILDLTNYYKRPPAWPDNTPDKIRLTKGKYEKEYDIHPTERRKKWYKEMVKYQKMQSPNLRHDWPIGMDVSELPIGVEITET